MFNVSLKIRDPKGLVIPKGPSFSSARTIRSDIDGTEISIKAPKHNPRRSNQDGWAPESRYTAESRLQEGRQRLNFQNYYDDDKAARGLQDHWRNADFFYHFWAFYGPWFTGAVAELSLSFRLVKVINYPEGMSLFHPRALEQVIGDYLTDMYSHHISTTRGNIQEFNAPVRWRPLHHLPVNTARLEVVSQDFSPHRIITHLVVFPLSNNLMATLNFWPSRIKNLPRSELDKLVDEQPMLDLMENIINSIELKLSPEAEAQQKAALEGLADTSLIKDYPPLKWDKLNEEEKQKILTAQ